MTDPPTVRIALEARAENVTIVRQALAGIAEALSVEPEVLADLKIAVSEACTNVVVHAYPKDEVGHLEIACWPRADQQLTVVVRDHGAGISPRVTESGPGLGLGLPLIAALAEEIQISSGPGRPTEVTMTFALAREPQDEGDEE